LAYIPYSHSVATGVAAALVTRWTIERGLGRRALGRAVAIGIVSPMMEITRPAVGAMLLLEPKNNQCNGRGDRSNNSSVHQSIPTTLVKAILHTQYGYCRS
jgi:hypothetical protein